MSFITLTHKLIEAGASASGGWNKAQIKCLGLEWSELKRGWKASLVGRQVTDADYAKFLALRKPDQLDLFQVDQKQNLEPVEENPEHPPW